MTSVTMVTKHTFLVLVFLSFYYVPGYCIQTRLIGHFHVNQPGFVLAVRSNTSTNTNSQSQEEYSLYISSFSGIPFTTDHVYRLNDIGNKLQQLGRFTPELVSDSIVWPNEINAVPDHVFGRQMVSVAGGFLVPFKTKGTVNLFDTSGTSVSGPYDIADDRSDHEWFYHRVLWADMNGDGQDDAVTCRAKKSIFGGSHGELLWFENPSQVSRNIFTSPWNHYVIGDHSDTFFDMATLTTPDGSYKCIVTTGYFSNQLKLYWTTDPAEKWTDKAMIQSRVIGGTTGHVFDVQVTDMNSDGNPDFLVTTNGNNGAAVYAFEVPRDFRTDNFVKHILMSGFHTGSFLPGSGAPGSAQVIKDTNYYVNGKPLILLSGDDDHKAYLLHAKSNSTHDWSYNYDVIMDMHSGTVGGISYKDVNGDGKIEIFVPAYSNNTVYIYTLES